VPAIAQKTTKLSASSGVRGWRHDQLRMSRSSWSLVLVALVIAGALGAFAIYTFGWHRQGASTARRAQIDRQHTALLAVKKTVSRDSQFLTTICDAFRAYRDPAYVQGAPPNVRYVVSVIRTWAVGCYQDHIK
jgi:hypothetical protein